MLYCTYVTHIKRSSPSFRCFPALLFNHLTPSHPFSFSIPYISHTSITGLLNCRNHIKILSCTLFLLLFIFFLFIYPTVIPKSQPLTAMATVTHSNNIDHSKEDPSRKRTRATAEQLAVLEDTFSVNVSPNSKLRKQLADQLKMTDRSIQIWFQNRRAKVKHMQKRAQLQMHQASMRAQLYHYQQQHYYLQQHYAPHQRAHSLDSYNMYRSTGVVGASSFVANGPATCPDSIANDFYSSSFETMPSNTMDQQRQSVPPPSLLPYADMIDLNADAWDFSGTG